LQLVLAAFAIYRRQRSKHGLLRRVINRLTYLLVRSTSEDFAFDPIMAGSQNTKWRLFSRRGKRRLSATFAIDVRSLAVVRIGLGVLLLTTLIGNSLDAMAHYSDAGVLSRAARIELDREWVGVTPPYWVSLHMLSGSTWFQVVLTGLALIPAIGVTVGYRTRLSIALSWLLLISLQGRNPLVLHGGDDLLRCVLFWSMFLPMGAVWSLDRRLARSRAPARVLSCATACILLQLYCVYWFTGLLKTDAVWRSDFTAIYYALNMDHFTTSFGYWLLQFPALLRVITCGTLLLELGGPTLLLLPLGSRRWRVVVPALMIGLHLGLAATMTLGSFPFVCMVYWLIVLPREFWRSRMWTGIAARTASATALVDRCSRLAGRTSWLIGRPAQGFFRLGVFGNWAATLLMIYVLLVNFYRLDGNIGTRMNVGPLRILGEAAQLDQYWGMFAPRPHATGGWFSIQGTLANGSQVNLLRPDQPIDKRKPSLVSSTYANMRWRRYCVNLLAYYSPIQRHGFSDYLRRQWNAGHDSEEQVVIVQFIHMVELIPPANSTSERMVMPITLLRTDYRTNNCIMARNSGIEGL
jgi:hypothetical protein